MINFKLFYVEVKSGIVIKCQADCKKKKKEKYVFKHFNWDTFSTW